jgi:hypothetical protein
MVRSSAIQHHRRSFGDSHAIDLSCKSSSEQTAADEKPASSTAASSVVRRTGALLPSAGTSGGGSLKQHPTAATAASYDHSNIEQAVERVIKASHYHGADKVLRSLSNYDNFYATFFSASTLYGSTTNG